MSLAAESVRQALKATGLSYRQYSKKAGIAYGTLMKFLGGRPPSPELLRQICTSWGNAGISYAILAAHLRDEMARSGIQGTDLEIRPTTKGADPELSEAFELLALKSAANPEVRTMLLAIARGMLVEKAAPGPQDPELTKQSPARRIRI